jgi:hypothetical protein
MTYLILQNYPVLMFRWNQSEKFGIKRNQRMMTENIQALVAFRLEQADESIETARTLLDKKLIPLL